MARKRWLLVGLAAVLTACSVPDRVPDDRTAAIEGIWQSTGYGHVFEIARNGAGKTRLTSYEQTSVSCLRGDLLAPVGRDGTATAFGEDGEAELVVRRQ